MLRATAACHFWTSELQKVARECGAHFDLQMCFAPQRRAIFEHQNYLQMCFAPQRRAIFRHRNFKNCSDTCNCAFRHSCVPFLNIATSKMAPRMWCFAHFDLQMCFVPQRRAIFHLSARTATSAPAALARLLFEHQEPRIIGKTQRFATSLTFFTRVPSFK